MDFPEYAAVIIERLRAHGYEAYAVGGCVRDSLLGRMPGDWDITTSALPQECAAVFDAPPFRVITGNGLRHGTVTVAMAASPHDACEITTFRCDGSYSDHRRPDGVRFVSDLREDLARRDFTVNAMAATPSGEFADPFGGQADLRAGIIRCVGEPERRFDEDALRILRGLRFAARYCFSIDPDPAAAMHRQAHLLAHIAPERIGAELTGILSGEGCGKIVRDFADIFAMLLPECSTQEASLLLPRADAWQIRLALLCRDADARRIRQTALHLALGADRAEEIARLVAHRDAPLSSHAALCRIADIFGERGFTAYFTFRRALSDSADIIAAETAVRHIFASGACYNTATLAVDGRALMRDAGIPAGRRLGDILRRLTEDVIEGRLPNRSDELMAAARRYAEAES